MLGQLLEDGVVEAFDNFMHGWFSMEKEDTEKDTERVNDLAREFVRIITEWLTDDELAELRDATAANTNPNTCPSHDYCDANQAMLNAGVAVGVDVLNDTRTVNAAWEIAKSKNWGAPATVTAVLAELVKLGYNASYYHTGGGIMCIAISATGQPIDKYGLIIGNGCGWGADCYDEAGEYTHSVNLKEIKDTDSALQVAATLTQAIVAQHYGDPKETA
jgi:hypothetical protein